MSTGCFCSVLQGAGRWFITLCSGCLGMCCILAVGASSPSTHDILAGASGRTTAGLIGLGWRPWLSVPWSWQALGDQVGVFYRSLGWSIRASVGFCRSVSEGGGTVACHAGPLSLTWTFLQFSGCRYGFPGHKCNCIRRQGSQTLCRTRQCLDWQQNCVLGGNFWKKHLLSRRTPRQKEQDLWGGVFPIWV